MCISSFTSTSVRFLDSPRGILFAIHLISASFYCPGSHFPAERLDSSVHHRKLRPPSSDAFVCAVHIPSRCFCLILFDFFFHFVSEFCWFSFSFCLPLSFGFKLINVAISMLWCSVRFLVASLVLANLKSLKTSTFSCYCHFYYCNYITSMHLFFQSVCSVFTIASCFSFFPNIPFQNFIFKHVFLFRIGFCQPRWDSDAYLHRFTVFSASCPSYLSLLLLLLLLFYAGVHQSCRQCIWVRFLVSVLVQTSRKL